MKHASMIRVCYTWPKDSIASGSSDSVTPSKYLVSIMLNRDLVFCNLIRPYAFFSLLGGTEARGAAVYLAITLRRAESWLMKDNEVANKSIFNQLVGDGKYYHKVRKWLKLITEICFSLKWYGFDHLSKTENWFLLQIYGQKLKLQRAQKIFLFLFYVLPTGGNILDMLLYNNGVLTNLCAFRLFHQLPINSHQHGAW